MMRVFVTGATGWVGSAVVKDLVASGHQVLGLCRDEAKAAALRAAGAEVMMGSLEDLDGLKRGASACDGVAHLAFNHDFSRWVENGQDERRAIAAIGDALEGTQKPLVATSGVALLMPGQVASEETQRRRGADTLPRDPESAVEALQARGIRATLVRLAPTVHGIGDKGFVPSLIGIAREKGVAAYIGDGSNRWPAVHRVDAARIYRLALEHGAEGGPFHGVAEEGVPMRRIAEAIGRQLGLEAISVPPEQAQDHFGWFAMFAGIDCPATSWRTRSVLGWEPTGPDLLSELNDPAYFRAGV